MQIAIVIDDHICFHIIINICESLSLQQHLSLMQVILILIEFIHGIVAINLDNHGIVVGDFKFDLLKAIIQWILLNIVVCISGLI